MLRKVDYFIMVGTVDKKYKIRRALCVFIIVLYSFVNLSIDCSAAMLFYLNSSDSVSFLMQAEQDALEDIEVTKGETVNGVSADLFLTFTPSTSSADDADNTEGPASQPEYTGTTAGGTGTGYYFNREFYQTLSTKQKRKVMKAFVESLKNKPLNEADKQIIYNALKDVGDQYITAEIASLLNSSSNSLFTAVSILKPFNSVVGTIMGVLTILISLGLVLSTVIDLCCLGIPFFGVKSDGTKPKFMTIDAFKALKESQESDTNVYLLYVKRRFVTYIIVILCVVYLVSGSLGDLFSSIVDLFGGVVG